MDTKELVAKYNLLSAWTEAEEPAPAPQCHDGWFQLLDKLIEDLIALGWDRRVAQIKEKFGGLRFYTGEGLSNRMLDRIAVAERESYSICQECSAPGELRPSLGWVRTLCGQHLHRENFFKRCTKMQGRDFFWITVVEEQGDTVTISNTKSSDKLKTCRLQFLNDTCVVVDGKPLDIDAGVVAVFNALRESTTVPHTE